MASSNWGGVYQNQGIVAPGMDILGASPGGGTAQKSGTSFATAVVTGFVGLLLSLQVQQGRAPDPHAVHAALLRTAAPCSPEDGQDCRRCLAGRLNVIESIALIRGGETTMSDADMVALSAISTPAEDTLSRDPPVSTSPAVPSVFDAAIRPSEAKARPIVLPTETAGVVPSCGVETKCACGSKETCSCGGGQKAALVYALGTLGYDFGSEARRDSLAQSMPSNANNPLLPDQLLGYLAANPYDAPSVIWTVNLDATPIYAVQPVGPYAAIGYERLREALSGQLARGVELVSVPGVIGGSVRLQSGQVVPVIVPSIRGIYCWATAPLVENVLGPKPKGADKQSAYERQSSGLSDFLNRVYYDLRNLGITAEERALNYSAVNAFQVAEVVRGTTLEELDLDKVNVKKSPVCRPDSDCYDVELLFFNPSNTNVANRVFRFTVDVSDVIPVTIGTVRSWTRRT
jgi:cyanobactin maturation PatA/PatG family protease